MHPWALSLCTRLWTPEVDVVCHTRSFLVYVNAFLSGPGVYQLSGLAGEETPEREPLLSAFPVLKLWEHATLPDFYMGQGSDLSVHACTASSY